jgi:uncharacterized membrane protein
MKKTETYQTIARVILGCFLIFTGTGHLTFLRTAFQAQVPDWVPLGKDLVVILSGVAEVTLGLALILWSKQKKLTGIAAALFFIAVFPGNISQYVNGIDAFGLNSDTSRLIRLLFQPLLVVWALFGSTIIPRKSKK